MDRGVYALILKNPHREIRIGALGRREFAEGSQIYVGSAHGSGGLARVERHIRLALRRDRSPRWHIDYLLLDPQFALVAAITAATDRDCECTLARAIGGLMAEVFTPVGSVGDFRRWPEDGTNLGRESNERVDEGEIIRSRPCGGQAAQLNVVSYGEERPTCSDSNDDCWGKNRRVEIVYTAK